MSWNNEVNEIKKRLSLIQEMGGKDKIKRQHDAGRSTVRERILALLDKNSFKEIGSLTGSSEYDENDPPHRSIYDTDEYTHTRLYDE